ncbi:MAG TPA: outer membrane beta-barrel protein [Terracidiphilus sp.]|nr:outer membrane beta-barrel protein [Terracidiphilus sp.]
MRNYLFLLVCTVLATGAWSARAQVVPSASKVQSSLQVGVMGSWFQPDYAGGGVPMASPQHLGGFGAYADFGLSRWVRIEGEARFSRWNQYLAIHQDNYLLGLNVPIHTFGPVTPYGKLLFGMTRMNFEYNLTTCRCATIAYGGGADVRLNQRWSVRAIDFEYQQLPNWVSGQPDQLHPYGFSAGIAYHVF